MKPLVKLVLFCIKGTHKSDLGLILPFTVVEILQLRGSIHCLQTISVRCKWQIIYGLDSGLVKFQIKFFVKYENIVTGIDDGIGIQQNIGTVINP